MADRKKDRHRLPRLPPVSIEQQYKDKITEISEAVGLPEAWVIRKLIVEALENVDIESLPNIFSRRRARAAEGD